MRGNLVTSYVGIYEDLSAPLELILGAEEEEGDDVDGAEQRSALLRTAGTHRRKTSASLRSHRRQKTWCVGVCAPVCRGEVN